MSAQSACAGNFAETHPRDAARVVEQSMPDAAAAYLSSLPSPTASAVLTHMSQTAGASCLSLMAAEHAAPIVAELTPGFAAALLRKLAIERHTGLLGSVTADRKELLSRLLSYPEGSAGALTDPDILTLPDDISIAEAQTLLRRQRGKYYHQAYVVDRANRLMGVIHVRELVRGQARDPVVGIMRPATVSLPATARMASVQAHPAWRELDAIPVLDDSGLLLGIVRHRQMRRQAPAGTSAGLLGTLVGLGELYWIGLSRFLPGQVGSGVADQTETAHSKGGRDDAQ